MKTLFAILFVGLFTVPAHAVGFWDALAMIESGQNDRAVGRAGEVSRYQLRPEYFARFDATNPRTALRVARSHMAALRAGFHRLAHRQLTEADCVILWKSGVAGYAARGFDPARMSADHLDRVERFLNLRRSK